MYGINGTNGTTRISGTNPSVLQDLRRGDGNFQDGVPSSFTRSPSLMETRTMEAEALRMAADSIDALHGHPAHAAHEFLETLKASGILANTESGQLTQYILGTLLPDHERAAILRELASGLRGNADALMRLPPSGASRLSPYDKSPSMPTIANVEGHTSPLGIANIPEGLVKIEPEQWTEAALAAQAPVIRNMGPSAAAVERADNAPRARPPVLPGGASTLTQWLEDHLVHHGPMPPPKLHALALEAWQAGRIPYVPGSLSTFVKHVNAARNQIYFGSSTAMQSFALESSGRAAEKGTSSASYAIGVGNFYRYRGHYNRDTMGAIRDAAAAAIQNGTAPGELTSEILIDNCAEDQKRGVEVFFTQPPGYAERRQGRTVLAESYPAASSMAPFQSIGTTGVQQIGASQAPTSGVVIDASQGVLASPNKRPISELGNGEANTGGVARPRLDQPQATSSDLLSPWQDARQQPSTMASQVTGRVPAMVPPGMSGTTHMPNLFGPPLQPNMQLQPNNGPASVSRSWIASLPVDPDGLPILPEGWVPPPGVELIPVAGPFFPVGPSTQPSTQPGSGATNPMLLPSGQPN